MSCAPAGASRFLYADEVFLTDHVVVGPQCAPDGTAVDCVIRRLPDCPNLEDVRWLEPGVLDPETYWIGREDDRHLIAIGNDALVVIAGNGALINYWISDQIDDGYLGHLLLDHALPTRLGVLGRTAVHGTSVVIDGRAIAFVGPTGAGKSTLAASFSTAGHPLLADDCLVLEPRADEHWVLPTYPGTRLLSDSMDHLVGTSSVARQPMSSMYDKHLVSTNNESFEFSSSPMPLDSLVFLSAEVAHTPSLAAVAPLAALTKLLDQVWYTEATGGELADLVDRIGAIVNGVPTLELRRPDDLFQLPACRQLIIDAVTR